ncbi:MAG: polyprenyl synthetase family protein [Rickettsiales bacterium]
MLKYPEFLESDLKRVDQILKKSISSEVDKVNVVSDYLISAGGKRIRPVFAILAAHMFPLHTDKHLHIAAAVEFIHTATLLHDDVVDESMLRRGKESANSKWGNKLSILVGDFLFAQSFNNMVASGSMQVMDTLSKASTIISEGEVEQLEQIGNIEMNFDQYYKIIRSKTAELFAAACKCGAIISGQNDIIQKKIYNFGLNFGIAFQIVDDLLDYLPEAKIGKDLGNDFLEKKITLPILSIAPDLSLEDKSTLKAYFSAMGELSMEGVVEMLQRYNAFEKTKKIADNYIKKAKDSLEEFEDSEAKSTFKNFLEYQVLRIS